MSVAVLPGDHPRVCGEHFTLLLPEQLAPGSSPRMRGTRMCSNAHTVHGGIIPAYAGNTYENGCTVVK